MHCQCCAFAARCDSYFVLNTTVKTQYFFFARKLFWSGFLSQHALRSCVFSSCTRLLIYAFQYAFSNNLNAHTGWHRRGRLGLRGRHRGRQGEEEAAGGRGGGFQGGRESSGQAGKVSRNRSKIFFSYFILISFCKKVSRRDEAARELGGAG